MQSNTEIMVSLAFFYVQMLKPFSFYVRQIAQNRNHYVLHGEVRNVGNNYG
ncbi:MAG: hypothetical protein HC785_26610 [Calothrix sp. CSU_2_0]|nr:hypothetical protein [Calothrix sp. CSU_2_0]